MVDRSNISMSNIDSTGNNKTSNNTRIQGKQGHLWKQGKHTHRKTLQNHIQCYKLMLDMFGLNIQDDKQ